LHLVGCFRNYITMHGFTNIKLLGLFDPEDEGTTLLRNTCDYLPVDLTK